MLGFMIFHNFLVNPEKFGTNDIVTHRFMYSKTNIIRLGISHYLGKDDYKQTAIKYSLHFLYNFPQVSMADLTLMDQIKREMIEWADR